MKKTSKSLNVLLILILFLAFSLPVHAESVTGEVYSTGEIVDLAVKVVPSELQLTVQFPKNFSEDVTADFFKITFQGQFQNKPSEVILLASEINTKYVTYEYKNLSNQKYSIQVTAYKINESSNAFGLDKGEVVATWSGTGVPVLKKIVVAAKGGDKSAKLYFKRLTGMVPLVQYWTEKNANGTPKILTGNGTITVQRNDTSETQTVASLINGKTYYFRVLFIMNSVIVGSSDVLTVTPKPPAK